MAEGFLRTVGDFDPRFDPRVKEQERLQQLTVGVEPRQMDRPQISIADLEGMPFVTSMSDRTAAGGMLTNIKGRDLNTPVNLRGGQDYMFDNNPGQVWASAKVPSNQMLTAAQGLRDSYRQNPVYLPWRMAPSGGDFAAMTGETMINFASSNMSKAEKRALNKAIKEYVSVGSVVNKRRVGAGLQIKGWKGVDDPSAVEVWRNTPDSLRKELMDKVFDVQFRNRGGLSIGEARLAVSDPAQLSAQDGGVQNVGRIFADADRTIDASTHPSYPYAVPGEGVGVLKEDVNVFQLLPDIVSQRGIPDPLNPRATDIRAMQMGAKTGIITADVLRNILGGGAVAAVGAGLMTPQEAEAAGLSALLKMGYPESTAKKILSGELPMDTASRTQRAKEQGFDTGDVQYHGTNKDFFEFSPSERGKLGPGVYTSPDPRYASKYIGQGEGRMIMPLLLRGDRIDRREAYDMFPEVRGRDAQAEINRRLADEGLAGTFIQKETTTFDPQNVRSVNAAFDPDQRNSSNIMALNPLTTATAVPMLRDGDETRPMDDVELARYQESQRRIQPLIDAMAPDPGYNYGDLLPIKRSTDPSVRESDFFGGFRPAVPSSFRSLIESVIKVGEASRTGMLDERALQEILL